MSITTLEDGFYITHPKTSPTFATRAIEVDEGKVQLLNGNGKSWFTVPQFFNVNVLVRKVTEDEANAA